MRRSCGGGRLTALVLTFAACWCGPSPGPSLAQDEARSQRGKWAPVFQKHAEEYEIAALGDGPDNAGATLVAEPLLRWWQPIRGGDDGALYLWVRGGRPVVAMTFFTLKDNDGQRWIVHEHQSLCESPLAGAWQGRPQWHTPAPGARREPLPEAPAPADSPAARLRQMQAIVRDFSAETTDYNGSRWPLRALAKPLYRYQADDPDLLDGALFAFVQGTDPEILLLLEARRDGGSARWTYALARLTDLNLSVRLKDRTVLTAPNTVGQPDAAYQTNIVIKKPSDDPADFAAP